MSDMNTDIIIALSAIINVVIVFCLAWTTKRYADATDSILRTNENTLKVLQISLHGSVYTWAADLLSRDEILAHRKNVFNNLPGFEGNLDEMPDDLRKSFKVVCRTYDLVGIAGHNKMLPHKIIAKEWGDSIIKSYEACRRHIDYLRIERGPMLWNNFSELYKEAKEIWQESPHNQSLERDREKPGR